MTGAMAALAAAAAEGASKGGLPQLNAHDFAPQLIWLALTFGALFFVMSKVALPRIGEVIEERRDRIQRDLDTADRLKSETEKALAGYEQALSDARGKASGFAKDTKAKLAAETDQERSRVEKQIAVQLASADARISATKAKALASVNEIASDTAAAVVNKLIGAQPSADEIQRALQAPAGE